MEVKSQVESVIGRKLVVVGPLKHFGVLPNVGIVPSQLTVRIDRG